MSHVVKRLISVCIFFFLLLCQQSDAWITLSKQGLIINKTHLSLQSSAQVEGDLLIKGVLKASDYTWISGHDSSTQDVCNANNVGALRWRNSSHDFFEGCDVSGTWQQVKFCDKDCGFPVVPRSTVRSFASGGPADCQAKVCSVNCTVGSIDRIYLPFLLSTESFVKQKCNSILAAISVDHNKTTSGVCSNVTISDYFLFSGQDVPIYFQNPESIICFVDSSVSCRPENCTDRLIQDIGWRDQAGVSGARWILLKDPTIQMYKFARENDLYYFEGLVYPMSITLHDLVTYEDAGTTIWPSPAVAKLPLELWRHDYLTNPGGSGAPFRGTRYLYQRRIPSVFDKDAVLIPSSVGPLTCAAFDFSAPSFDYLRIFYNVSGWERVLPPTPPVDDNPAAAMAEEPEVLTECVGGFRRTLLPPFWLLSDRTEAENSSWVGSITSGPPVICTNGTCVGMNCSVAVMAPVGFAVQVLVELDLDALPAHRGDRFTLIELTADGRQLVLLDRQGVDPNATAVSEFNATASSLNGTNATNVTCGNGGIPCNETVTSGGPGVLVLTTQFGSTVLARFQSTGRSAGRGFNLTYGYVSRLALLRHSANATLLQLSLALLEAQGANGRGFLWTRARNEVLSPAPLGTASLGNMTDAEGCFLCFYYNGSCQGISACGDAGCDTGMNIGSAAPVEGGPIPAPWSAQALGPAQVGAVGPLFKQFRAHVSMQEVPAVVTYMGYQTTHFVRTEHVSAFPPGTVKAPFAAVLGERPEWGPYGDKDPSTFRTHPLRAAVGWDLVPVFYGSGDQTHFEHLKNDLFGPAGEFPAGSASSGGGTPPGPPPDWQVLVPRSSVAYVSARRWTYDLDSVLVPSFSFVDEDRRLVIANELAMFVPCGMAINNTCGAPCLVTGTALNLFQCGAAVAATRCNEPVVDNCNNECGIIGTLLCNSSALDAGAIRLGSLMDSNSTVTFQLTTQYEPSSGMNALFLSYHDPSENCNPSAPDFDPETNACYYTNRGKFSPYLLSPSQLKILSSKSSIDLPISVECQGKSSLCKFNDPLELTPNTNSRWKLNGQTLNATSPWWEQGVPDKRMSWAELRAVVTATQNAQILGVLYVEDIVACIGSCSLRFGSIVTTCRSHCLVALAASLMLTFGADGSNFQLCKLPSASGNNQGKVGLWPTSSKVDFPPEGNFPSLDSLCLSSTCTEFFPSCYVSINNIQKMKSMFEARRRSMMREVYNRPGFNLAKLQRLGQGRSGIEISSPRNIAANKPQQRVENTFRISFLQQIFEKDVLIGNGMSSRIFFESVIDKACPFKFNPSPDGSYLQLCINNGQNITNLIDTDVGLNSTAGGKNRTITVPDVSGKIITTQSLQDLTSIPGLRKRKRLTVAGTEYPRYGIWPLPKYSKVPDPFSQGNFITEVSYNIRPFQGLGPRYCQLHEDGSPTLCDQLQHEYDVLENDLNDGDESIVFTGPNLLNESSYFVQNGTTSIEFIEPSQHQKISFPDASAALISSGNLKNITKTGILVSPIVASSAENAWTRLKFGVGWETVNITGENNILDYQYTQGSYIFCRAGMNLPRIVASNAWTLPNFKICSQYHSDAILFDMGPEWTAELAAVPSGKCVSMYMVSDSNVSSLPEVNSLIILTGFRGQSSVFNVTSIHDICQRNIFGLDEETCANSGSKVSFLDPYSQAAIVSVYRHRYVLCSVEILKNFSEATYGKWNLTRYRSLMLPGGIYSLENITNSLNSKLMEQLNNSDVRLNFNIREPNEGLCAERPLGTTYNFSFFHCAQASRYIELHGEVISVKCNITNQCNDMLSCPIFCNNISNPESMVQVLGSSTILESLGIPKPVLAYTFGATTDDLQYVRGTLQPVAPGSGFISSGFGRNSGFGLGGDSSWYGFVPPNPSNTSVPYTAWCHDGLGYLCFQGCLCNTLVITFSRILGQTKTKIGASPSDNILIIPRTADGLLISTGNLADIRINSSSISSLHINALRQHDTAVGAIVGQRLEFQGPQVLSSEYLNSGILDASNYIPNSGLELDHNVLAIHSYQYLSTWVAIYSPDGRCADLIKAIDSNDTESAWIILANFTFCANRTFSSLQDTSSLNASKYSCLEYCASVDYSKEQENTMAKELLTGLKSDSSNAIDTLLDDPTPYCVSVGCNGSASNAPNLTIDFYLYGISRSGNAPSDPYSAAIASRKPCSVICTRRVQCSEYVRNYLSRRPPPYDFSLLSTAQGWDTCVRMIELEAKFTPALSSKFVSAKSSFQTFQQEFTSYTNRATQAAFALQQRCSCVELQGYSAGVSNGLSDVVNHVCQSNLSPVCSSEDILKPFPAGLPWTTKIQFSDGFNETENAVRFLVVPFVSAIVLSNLNLESITVDSGSLTSLNVEEQTFFNSYVKVGIVREGMRASALSHGSRAVPNSNSHNAQYGPLNECEGCLTAGTCETVCKNAENELVLNNDGLFMYPDIARTGDGNSSNIRAATGLSQQYEVRFPTWDYDLCNGNDSSHCLPRSLSNAASFVGTVITTGNLADIYELSPNFLEVAPDGSDLPAHFSGSIEIGSQFSCVSGNSSGYGGRGWTSFAGAGCAEQETIVGTILAGKSVQQCKQICEVDSECGVLVVNKLDRNGLNRAGDQSCTFIHLQASKCTVISSSGQDLYLNFREAPSPWSRSQASNQFFTNICANTNVSFVAGTPISINGYLSTGITWRSQKPYSWKYYADSMCDTFDPTVPAKSYMARYQNYTSVEFCKNQCLMLNACAMVSVSKKTRTCYLLPAVSTRRALVNGSDSCGGRESVADSSLDATTIPCLLQGPCMVVSKQAADLYVYVQNQGVTISFSPPSKPQAITFPNASGVVVTTGNLYDVSSIWGLQGSDVINYTAPDFTSFSSNQSEFWLRYNTFKLQLRTFKSTNTQNYLEFSGTRLISSRTGKLSGNIILRECDFSPPQTAIWKVDNPSFAVSGLPNRDCLAIPGCVMFTNINDPSLLAEAQNSLTQERKSRPGLNAQPTSFRNIFVGTGSGFDSFSYILDFAKPGSRVSNTSCLRNCAGGVPCERGIGYLPCQRGTLGCHIRCPGYMFPRPGVSSSSPCAGNAVGSFVTGLPCGCAGGSYYQNADGNTYGTSVCVIPNITHVDNGRFCSQGGLSSLPKGWLPAALCCRNSSDVKNCGVCTEFPPLVPDGDNNRITFPDTSGTVITTGNMDDLTVLTLQLDNLVISGSLDLGIISQSTTPTFGSEGYHFDPSSGTGGIWRTAINLDPYTTKIVGGLPMVAGIGSPGHEYLDPITGNTFAGGAQFYPLTHLINSPVTDLAGSSRNDLILYCKDSVAFQMPTNADTLLDARERTGLTRCGWKREILLPSTNGIILVDSMLRNLSSISIPRQNLLLHAGSSVEIQGNLALGYRQNYSSDPVNVQGFISFPEFHGLGISGLELGDPQEIRPFQQPYQSVLRAYALIDGDIGITLSSASDIPLELPQSREVQDIPDYGENCVDPLCTRFSTTHYGSSAPTAEVSRFAKDGRLTDNRQRKYQEDSVQLSPACLSGIDTVLRALLRAGAPDLPFFVKEGQGILTQEGGIYSDTTIAASRPIIQARKTILPFVPESKPLIDSRLLPKSIEMMSETVIISEKYCNTRYLTDDIPKNANGQVNRNSFTLLLLSKGILGKDASDKYSVNSSALLDPLNMDIAILLKCASYGYYPLWLQNNVTEIILPESNGYILTSGSLEDISMASGNFTSLSVSEDIFIEGNLIIGSSTHSSKLTILSNIDINLGVRLSGSVDSESTLNIGPGSSVDDTYVFLPDTFGTLVVGDLPPTLGSLDMLADSDLTFESSVRMGADSTIGGLGENTVVTLYASLIDSCPLRFSRSANSISELTVCTKDPSGDNTIYLPDESGTILTASQLVTLKNITSLEMVVLQGESVLMDGDVQIGGISKNDILTLNANIMGLNAITFDGAGVKDGKTLALSAGDPTAQNEITLPDCSGTVITSANFPTVFERLTVIDSFVTKGTTRLVGDKISLGSSDRSAPSQIKIYADLIGDYPLVFDGASDSSEFSLTSTTSFAVQPFAGENIISFPDTSGIVITSASIPSIISTDQEYRLTADGLTIYSEAISMGLVAELPKCLGCFSFADSASNMDFSDSLANNSFSVKAFGGIYFFTGKSRAGNYIGASLRPNSGSWSYLSDKNAKRNLFPINTSDMLMRLVQKVPISIWYYNEDHLRTRHMGPYAQDFGAAFDVGSDLTRIVSSDMDGAILGSIQGMYDAFEALRKEKEGLENLISALDKEIESNNLRLNKSITKMSQNNDHILSISKMLGNFAAEQDSW